MKREYTWLNYLNKKRIIAIGFDPVYDPSGPYSSIIAKLSNITVNDKISIYTLIEKIEVFIISDLQSEEDNFYYPILDYLSSVYNTLHFRWWEEITYFPKIENEKSWSC